MEFFLLAVFVEKKFGIDQIIFSPTRLSIHAEYTALGSLFIAMKRRKKYFSCLFVLLMVKEESKKTFGGVVQFSFLVFFKSKKI